MDLNQLINRSVVVRMFCRCLVMAFVFPYSMCIIFGIRLTVDFIPFVQEKKLKVQATVLGFHDDFQ